MIHSSFVLTLGTRECGGRVGSDGDPGPTCVLGSLPVVLAYHQPSVAWKNGRVVGSRMVVGLRDVPVLPPRT